MFFTLNQKYITQLNFKLKVQFNFEIFVLS